MHERRVGNVLLRRVAGRKCPRCLTIVDAFGHRAEQRGPKFDRDTITPETRSGDHPAGFEAIERSPDGARTHPDLRGEVLLGDVDDDALAGADSLEESDPRACENPNHRRCLGRRVPPDERERNRRIAALESTLPGRSTTLEVILWPSEGCGLNLESHAPAAQLTQPDESVSFEAGEFARDHATRESAAGADAVAQLRGRVGDEERTPSRAEDLEQRQARVDELREDAHEDQERRRLERKGGVRERRVPGKAREKLGSRGSTAR